MTEAHSRTYLKPCLLAALVLTLAACETPPQQPQPPATDPEATVEQPLPEQTLQMPASEHGALFAAAEEALSAFDPLQADALLSPLVELELNGDDSAYLTYLRARIAFQQGDLATTDSTLQPLSQAVLHPAMRARLLYFQRHRAELAGNYLESAELALELSRRFPAQAQELRLGLWRDVARMTPTQRSSALSRAMDAELRGYLELANQAYRSGQATDPARLLAWQQAHPDHAASNNLPGGLGYLLDQPSKPQEVALILPLSGRLSAAAKAVRDGYLAAYYRDQQRQHSTPVLRIYDSGQYADVREAYLAAITAGAGLVIGPLSKQAVADLAMLPGRQVPVLALNRIDQALPQSNAALVQLSLATEDEAARIAELAFGQGARRALVVRPEGNWGDKMERALRTRFQPLGGTVASTAIYAAAAEYSGSIESALNIPASEQRSREVRGFLAGNTEFTARRREDLDAVFLLARNSAEARSLKPLLAYHYAGDLPVWATSSAYSGRFDERDRDLNGLQLVEMPWLLGQDGGLRSGLDSAGENPYTRLNALGADAYLLQHSFSQLQAGPETLISGATGLLRLDPELRLLREPQLAAFDGGELSRP